MGKDPVQAGKGDVLRVRTLGSQIRTVALYHSLVMYGLKANKGANHESYTAIVTIIIFIN